MFHACNFCFKQVKFGEVTIEYMIDKNRITNTCCWWCAQNFKTGVNIIAKRYATAIPRISSVQVTE